MALRKGIAGGELIAGRRQQGHMGAAIGTFQEAHSEKRDRMLSRVADSLYWMSRYLERAENTVRQLDVTMSLMLDTGGPDVATRWQRMMAALGKPDGMPWDGALEPMARRLIFDQINPASIVYCVNAARENARQVREEISTEQWQRVNRLYHHIHSPHAQSQFALSHSDLLASIIDGIYLFKGTTDTTMIHGQGWQFIRSRPLPRTRVCHRYAARGLSARSLSERRTRRCCSTLSRICRPPACLHVV